MIGQGIQEKTSTPARCVCGWGKLWPDTAKCSRSGTRFTTKKSGHFPFRRELFTFSTGFSTVFVKKRPSFPRGFPLFPPGFPQENCVLPIQAVMQAGVSCQFLGRKVGTSPFIKKKVEGFSSLFTVHSGLHLCISPIWKKWAPSFPHCAAAAFSCGKSGENCGFPPLPDPPKSRTIS